MTFTVNNTEYRIEFRHINKASKFGARKLRYIHGFKGMTTCVVAFRDPVLTTLPTVVAIETVFCSEDDPFTKEQGRFEALTRTLRNCKRVPRADIGPLLAAYENRGKGETTNVQATQSVQFAG